MRRGLCLTVLFFLGAGTGMADHLPAALVARGQPEHVLAGIDVYKTSVDSLVERFGKPVSFKKYPETEEAGEVVWNLKGTVVHASMNVNGTAYAVEVSGTAGDLPGTGKGLRLGEGLKDVQRDYGTRFLRRGDQVTLQWSDETELRLRFAGQRIVSMLLVANVE